MDDQPNNRSARIQGRWRHLIHLSIFLLGAAALYLRLSGDNDGYWNFFLSNNNIEEDEGHRRRHLLRDTISRRRTAAINCNRFHRRPGKCDALQGCAHNGNICVPEHMMMMQFSNMAADTCTKFNGQKRKCRRSGCAYFRSDKTCKLPSHECEAFNGRGRACNRRDKCVFNPTSRQCDLMTQTSIAMNVCTKKRYRACRTESTCMWKDRNCSLKSSSSGSNTGTQVTTTTTTTTTPAAGSTTCWDWHPLPGQQTGQPICTNSGNVPTGWTTDCQHTNGVLFFNSGQECCAGYFKNAANCEFKTEQELEQDKECHAWHPSIKAPKTCTNDDDIPPGWKNGCPNYNGQLFFESPDECCDTYFNTIPKNQCKEVDINNMNQNSGSGGTTAGDGSCHSWHPSITDGKTCTNDDNIIAGWKDGCPHYNGQLFFTSGEECCEKYYNTVPQNQCKTIDINNSGALTTTTTTTTTTTAATTPATPQPSRKPTPGPTPKPSKQPTPLPTKKPSPGPTPKPSKQPTPLPTKKPSPGPTPKPSKQPTPLPTKKPSPGPTPQPSKQPTPNPTNKPSPGPTSKPSKQPTPNPTNKPSPGPTPKPSKQLTPNPTNKPSPGPTPKPSMQPTPNPTKKPSPGPTSKPSKQPTPNPTNKPSPGPTPKPSKQPTPNPTKKPSPGPTLPPQDVKWYPRSSGSGKECVQGGDYPPSFPLNGWIYETETDCCKAWQLNCGDKDVKWYPASSNGQNVCVEGTGYSWTFVSNGWLFNSEESCCDSMNLDCTPLPEKWYPTVVNGEKACIFGEVEPFLTSFDSKGECCAAYPLACPTTTTTTTTTRPAVVTPPCQPSGGKGCHWWPDLVDWEIQCVYSSDWPPEAADLLYSEHETCYCAFNEC